MSDCNVDQWRNKHRKCNFCKYSAPLAPMDLYHGDDIWCVAKKCAKNRYAARPFCTLFACKKTSDGGAQV